MAAYVTRLTINPQFATAEAGFSLPSLLRHSSLNLGQDRPSYGVTLERCFEWFSVCEVLDEQNKWYCPSCKQFVRAKKQMEVWSVPKCLIIHLKRFTQHSKLDTVVEFPDVLDMSPYVAGTQKSDRPLLYRLYAVSNHYGGLHGGHYTAHALVVQPGKTQGHWYLFDDSYVRAAAAADAHSSAAYVLYYERVDQVTLERAAAVEGGRSNDFE
jgi:ubiquitin carboxyl-terminal hydrolase 4/11/15